MFFAGGDSGSDLSSTSSLIPLGVRVARCARIIGFCACTRRRAATWTAAGSPAGGDVIVSLGMRRPERVNGASCISESTTNTTSAIGGVIAILYARTADSAESRGD